MRTAIAPSSIAPYRTLRAPFVNGERRSRPRLPKEGYSRIESVPGRALDGSSPNLHVKAIRGCHGNVATHSIAVNTIPKAPAAPPGLHTMRSLALPSFAGGK